MNSTLARNRLVLRDLALTPEIAGVCCLVQVELVLYVMGVGRRQTGFAMPTNLVPHRMMTHVVRFDCYEADLDSGELRKRGIRIRLREQSFQVLTALLEHPGQVVTRKHLKRLLWQGKVFVDFDNNLNAVVAHLREVLCDSAEHPRFIETLPKRGYRLIADVYSLPTAERKSSRTRLVVLPFVNLSGDPAQEYFSDAITDEIITALASLAPERLAVIARTTAMHYKASNKDVGRIGRELNVDYVVEGGLRRDNDHTAINVQLIQTRDQAHLFAKKYDPEMRDVFRIQSSIAQDIARHVPSLANSTFGECPARKPMEDLAAYTEYIKGRYEMWKWTPEGVTKAKQHFEAALAQDPKFASACDGLAELYWYLGFWGFLPPEETEPIRRFYALRAFELDPTLFQTHALVAFHPDKCHYIDAYAYNWTETEKQMGHARDLSPNSPLIRVRHATVLLVLGRIAEAVAELECALEFDPLSPEVRFWLAEVLFFGHQYKRALEQAMKLLELEPDHHVPYMVLGQIYLGLEKLEKSAVALRRAVELSGELPLMLGWLGLVLGLGGHAAEAKTILKRLQAIDRHGFVLPSSFAWVYLGLGDVDEAFVWMKRAIDRNDGWIPSLKHYPFLDRLHSDPRFPALLQKLNLEA